METFVGNSALAHYATPSEHSGSVPSAFSKMTDLGNLADGYVGRGRRVLWQLVLMLATVDTVSHAELMLQLLDLTTLVTILISGLVIIFPLT
jgi:hypothetical protein